MTFVREDLFHCPIGMFSVLANITYSLSFVGKGNELCINSIFLLQNKCFVKFWPILARNSYGFSLESLLKAQLLTEKDKLFTSSLFSFSTLTFEIDTVIDKNHLDVEYFGKFSCQQASTYHNIVLKYKMKLYYIKNKKLSAQFFEVEIELI